jgi:predicted negative regulator of RcsB-dependent stress response
MQALGVIEMINESVSFRETEAVPARPSVRDAFDNSVRHSSRSAGASVITPDADSAAGFERSLARAQLAAAKSPTSTTLAILAQTLEASGQADAAVEAANASLKLVVRLSTGELLDPVAVRVALEVLLRSQSYDEAMKYALTLPIDVQTQLLVAATLAEASRFDEARDLLDRVKSEQKDPLLAFVLLSEGHNQEAIPLLPLRCFGPVLTTRRFPLRSAQPVQRQAVKTFPLRTWNYCLLRDGQKRR